MAKFNNIEGHTITIPEDIIKQFKEIHLIDFNEEDALVETLIVTKYMDPANMTDENISKEIVRHLKKTFEGYMPIPANIILGE